MATLTRGERFKDARNVYNQNGKQTMREVEQATGVNKAKIHDLEDDEKSRSVGYEDISALAKHYGVTADYLLSLTNDPFRVPSVVDDLRLSIDAIQWIKSLANSPDQSRYTSHLNTLLEMSSFQTLVFSLIEYFSALKAATVSSNILKCVCEGASDLYPESKTYMDKLKAATQDPRYDDMERWHLEAHYGFEKAYMEQSMFNILDDENGGVHILDILELKINRNLTSVIRAMEDLYE